MHDFDLDFHILMYHLLKIGVALILTLPLALNREHRSEGAGLRTFPLVAIAACAFMLVAMSVYEGSQAEAKVMYGVITGIGFIGGGAIVKDSGQVGGTATAAGIWITGAIGVAVAYGHYEIACMLSLVTFIIFQFFTYFKKTKQVEKIGTEHSG